MPPHLEINNRHDNWAFGLSFLFSAMLKSTDQKLSMSQDNGHPGLTNLGLRKVKNAAKMGTPNQTARAF